MEGYKGKDKIVDIEVVTMQDNAHEIEKLKRANIALTNWCKKLAKSISALQNSSKPIKEIVVDVKNIKCYYDDKYCKFVRGMGGHLRCNIDLHEAPAEDELQKDCPLHKYNYLIRMK